ncbi:unnamed protein product [Phytomonas sp. EM1]|nr:unnamed protein product [Phytomonas sp. EM1]|eukprot:CCW61522.1 unnamed protein product [Phytomonas sp. isolate EM1]
MTKNKSQQAKSRIPATEAVILGEMERIITVVFHAELTDVAKWRDELNLLASVRLHHESAEVHLNECFTKCIRENGTHVSKGLMEKRIVLDFEAMRELFRSDMIPFVELRSVYISSSSSSDLDNTQKNAAIQKEERGFTNALDSRKHLDIEKRMGRPLASLAKGNLENSIQKAALLASESAKVEKIFSIPFFLQDLMRARSQTYPVEVSKLEFLKRCWIEVHVRDDCLIPDVLLHRCRPVSVRVTGIQQIDQLLLQEKQPKRFRVSVGFAGHTLVSPYQSATCPSECGDVLRGVLLLGDQTPLEVYQAAMLSSVEVSLSLANEAPTSAAGRAGSATEMGMEHLVDVGALSVRALATDRQTFFDTDVQLLPSRTSFAFHAENCLTKACAVRLKLNFFIPLPTLQHVDEYGESAAAQFLSRSMIMVPYAAPCISAFLDTMVRELLSSKRAGQQGNVTLHQLPPLLTETSADGDDTKSEATRVSKASLPGDQRKRKTPGDKTEATLAQVTSSLSKPTIFEQPFKVVTPPGISGFEVADGEFHFVCLEGPVGELHRITRALYEVSGDSGDVRFWMNRELFVPMRYYHHYPPLVTPPGGHVSEHPDTEGYSQLTTPSTAKGPTFAAADTDVDEAGGGCGGRIHRIRLSESLLSLAARPCYLLRHTLSRDCLECIHKLHQLRQCHTLREAFERNLFPSAESLIAVERTFGSTLSLVDIFGRDEYKSSVHHHPPSEQGSLLNKRVSVCSPISVVNISELKEENVGRLIFFQGIRAETKTQPIPRHLFERFHNLVWMQTDAGEQVLCAFQKESPSSTIRYHVDGQIVRFGNTHFLYVLAHHSLAKSMTNSKNPAFETILRERNRREKKKQLDTIKKHHKTFQECCPHQYEPVKKCSSVFFPDSSSRASTEAADISSAAILCPP